MAEPQSEYENEVFRSSVCWDFTLRATSPGKTFPTEDAFLPWIDQMFAQHPTGMELIILPNASRPNPYATPYGFVAVLDPTKPVHPLLFDRHFGLGTTAVFLAPPADGPFAMFESNDSKFKALGKIWDVAREHKLVGEGSSLSLCQTVVIERGVACPRYALVVTAENEEVSSEFTDYVETCFEESIPSSDAFLLERGLAKVKGLIETAKRYRVGILDAAMRALEVSAKSGLDAYSDTPYHGLSYMARTKKAVYISYGVLCTDVKSLFRAISPTAGFVELLGGWSGVPEAMTGFPTTMHCSRGASEPVEPGSPYLNQYIASGNETIVEAIQPSGTRFAERLEAERELEGMLGRRYIHAELHWYPIVLFAPTRETIGNQLDASVLSDIAFM